MMGATQLFVLSGQGSILESVMRTVSGAQEIELVSLEEKNIARIRDMVHLVRSQRSPAVGFACKDLTLQRYQFVLKTYLALARSKSRFLLDETGRSVRWNPWSYFGVEIPRLVAELAASAWILLRSYVHLKILLKTPPRTPR